MFPTPSILRKHTSRAILLIACLSFMPTGCKKTIEEPIAPYNIFTHQVNGNNFFKSAFALPDNSFVITTEDRSNNFTILYKFSSDLKLSDTTLIQGHTFTDPIVNLDGSFIMAGESYAPGEQFIVVKLDRNLNLTARRDISHLYYASPDAIYPSRITRLTNGNIVFSNPYESYPKDRVVSFCVGDPFTDNDVKWRIIPPYNKKWVEGIYPGETGSFYMTCNDHIGALVNFVDKYDASGNLLFSTTIPMPTYCPLYLHVEDDRVILNDYESHHILSSNGDLLSSVKINEGFLAVSSRLLYKNGFYFYAENVRNSDGFFIEINKADKDLHVVKTALYGSRNTNNTVNFSNPMPLLELSSGEMVFLALVENPGSNGNNWLMLKFNEDLGFITN